MKYVWIQYYPGDCGTFFAWFVNQHQGFLRNRLPFKINDPVKNEVICDPMMWEWDLHDFVEDFLQGRIIDDRTELFDELDVRVSFKTYPQHCWQAEDQEQGLEDPDLFERYSRMKEISKELSSVLLVVTEKHKQHFINRMAACFDTFDQNKETGETETAQDTYRNRHLDYDNTKRIFGEMFPECKLFTIDMGELLFELNEAEYAKLCKFLNMPKNPHWKILMQFYRHQVFENY